MLGGGGVCARGGRLDAPPPWPSAQSSEGSCDNLAPPLGPSLGRHQPEGVASSGVEGPDVDLL